MTKQLILVALLVVSCRLFASVPLGRAYISPDGKYSASVEYVDGYYHVEIVESKKNSGILASIRTEALILYMKWLPASNALIIIHHLAGGNYLSLITSSDRGWHDFDYYISEAKAGNEEFSHGGIYQYLLKDDKVTAYFTYQVQSTINFDVLRYRKDKLVISLSNGKVEKKVSEDISNDMFEKLWSSAHWSDEE
jgi:hypothetical protein